MSTTGSNAATTEAGIAAHRSTISRKHRVLAGLASVAALAGATAACAGIAGTGTAGAAPLATQTTMIIVNHSNVTEQLVSADPDGGQWITAPKQTLLPGESETVVAATNAPEQHIQLNYLAQNQQQSQITYGLHTSATGTDKFNTGVADDSFVIRADIVTGFPDAVARYNLR